MRVGGDSRGLVGVLCLFAFFLSLYLFSLLAAGCIPFGCLSIASRLCCFGFNNIPSFTHKINK